MVKPLPIGIQTFSKIINGGYVYIDKTNYLYDLITKGEVYFISRPRRFGKSLLISTLKEIFEGNKELFKGLWIYNSDYKWQKYPVLRFDYSMMRADNKEELKSLINSTLDEIAENNNIVLKSSLYNAKFKELLTKLAQQTETGKVVILVDEYDAPIIQHITDIEKAKEMREILKGFYTIIKSMDEVVRFVLLTGISKFSKAGVFSGLNNLEDITMAKDYSSILGLTEEEIEKNLSGHIEKFANEDGEDKEGIIRRMRLWYNGYCFSDRCEKVYNPFSTFNALKHRSISNYWFESGTPTFLINLIREKQFNIMKLPTTAAEETFSVYELEQLSVLPLLFQTGYLTIKGVKEEEGAGEKMYVLDYPNFEVKNSFLRILVKNITGTNGETDIYLIDFRKTLRENDLVKFFELLRKFFVEIPYRIQVKDERYYQSIFYLIFQIIGLGIKVEVMTDVGRIDAVIETDNIYIFEFKMRGSKEEALKQIKEMRYYEKYEGKGKEIHLIGVKFNVKGKEGDYFEWIEEKYQP